MGVEQRGERIVGVEHDVVVADVRFQVQSYGVQVDVFGLGVRLAACLVTGTLAAAYFHRAAERHEEFAHGVLKFKHHGHLEGPVMQITLLDVVGIFADKGLAGGVGGEDVVAAEVVVHVLELHGRRDADGLLLVEREAEGGEGDAPFPRPGASDVRSQIVEVAEAVAGQIVVAEEEGGVAGLEVLPAVLLARYEGREEVLFHILLVGVMTLEGHLLFLAVVVQHFHLGGSCRVFHDDFPVVSGDKGVDGFYRPHRGRDDGCQQ